VEFFSTPLLIRRQMFSKDTDKAIVILNMLPAKKGAAYGSWKRIAAFDTRCNEPDCCFFEAANTPTQTFQML